jgi:hypothetical protein
MSKYIVLSVLVNSKYPVEEAKTWIQDNGYILRKVHTTKDYHRFRQHTTKYAKDRGCDVIRTISLNENIDLIIAYPSQLHGAGLIDTAKAVIFGRSDYPNDQKQLIDRYGSQAITHVSIGRTPLPKLLTSILNIVSLGQFQSIMKQSPYDKLYHLFCIITLSSGVKILLEKNEAINMKVVSSYNPKNTEYINATYIPSGLTFKELLDNGQKIQGKKWYVYNAVSNNCQDFLIAVLKGSSILTKQLQDFIKQDVKSLFDTLPISKKIVDVATDIGNKIDIIKKGGIMEEELEGRSKHKKLF